MHERYILRLLKRMKSYVMKEMKDIKRDERKK